MCKLWASRKCSYQICVNLTSSLGLKILTSTVVSLGPLENLKRPPLATKPRTIFDRDLSWPEPLPPILTVTRSFERNFSNLKKVAELAAEIELRDISHVQVLQANINKGAFAVPGKA
jgi:hypothetical protein